MPAANDKMVIEQTNEPPPGVSVVLNVATPQVLTSGLSGSSPTQRLSAADQSVASAPIRILRNCPFWRPMAWRWPSSLCPIRSEDFQPAVR